MATDQINDECEQYLENLMKQKKEQWKMYHPRLRRCYLLYEEFSRAVMEEMPIPWKNSIDHAMAIHDLSYYVFWNHVTQFRGPIFQSEDGDWEYYLPVV